MPEHEAYDAAQRATMLRIKEQLSTLLELADAAGADVLAAHLSLSLETAVAIARGEQR